MNGSQALSTYNIAQSQIPLYLSGTNSIRLQPLIRRAAGTTELSKLVSETRAQMREENKILSSFIWSSGTSVGGGIVSADVGLSASAAPQLIVLESPARRSRPVSQDSSKTLDQTRTPAAGAPASTTAEPKDTDPAPAPSATVSKSGTNGLQRAPGAALHNLAKLFLNPELYGRYVEPHLADMWHEYSAAIHGGDEKKARRIVWRGHFEILWPLVFAIGRMALKVCTLIRR